MRAGRFDEAWLLPNSLRAALTVFLAGVDRRLGYATDRRGPLLTDALPPPPGTQHQLRDYDALLSHAGVPPDEEPPSLPIPAEAARRAREALAAAGAPEDAILPRPGSASSATKRWPAERFAALADAFAARGTPCAVAIGPSERELGESVAKASRARPPVLGADLDAVELAAVFATGQGGGFQRLGPRTPGRGRRHSRGGVLRSDRPGRTAPSGASVRILESLRLLLAVLSGGLPVRA